jgi:hypothetical protein
MEGQALSGYRLEIIFYESLNFRVYVNGSLLCFHGPTTNFQIVHGHQLGVGQFNSDTTEN